MKRLAVLFVVLLGVSACEYAAGNVALIVVGTDLSSLMFTGKTLLDHGASSQTGKNCSSVNAEKREPYCQDWIGQDVGAVTLYCYPTLGQPECYVDPLPNRQSRQAFAGTNPEI